MLGRVVGPLLCNLSEPTSASAEWGFVTEALRALLALAAVCVIAWVVLRIAASRGLGRSAQGESMRVAERLALSPKHALLLVEVRGRTLLVGLGGDGPPRLLSDLGETERASEMRRLVPLAAPQPGGTGEDELAAELGRADRRPS